MGARASAFWQKPPDAASIITSVVKSNFPDRAIAEQLLFSYRLIVIYKNSVLLLGAAACRGMEMGNDRLE